MKVYHQTYLRNVVLKYSVTISSMNILKRYGKIILFDTLAVLCFIGVILFGWLPGPGGIPLFLLGLSLLAVNHDWAERWLETAKHKGVSFKKWIFPDIQWIRHTYDVLTISGTIIAITVLVRENNRLIEGAAVAVMVFCLFVFLVNRDRFGKFADYIKPKKPQA